MKLTKKMIAIIAAVIVVVIILIVALVCIIAKPHTHEFGEPTCTKPATCTICGALDGMELGHTTKYGVCARCNELQGESTYEDILAKLDTLKENIKEANTYVNANTITSIKDNGSNVTKSFETIKDDSKVLDDLVKVCGEIDELQQLKAYVLETIAVFPEKPVDSTPANLTFYIEEYQKYVKAVEVCETEFTNVSTAFVEEI